MMQVARLAGGHREVTLCAPFRTPRSSACDLPLAAQHVGADMRE